MLAPAVILFDLDDVLVRYDRTARVQHLAQATGATVTDVWRALFESGLETESDLGHWQPQDYANELGRRLGRPVSLGDCVAARAAATQADDAVCARVRQLEPQVHCAILTNNGFFLRDGLPVICPPLFPTFAGRVYTSAEFGVAKPDPEIFRRCLQALDVAAHRALLVDDNAANVRGALVAGLDAVHFTGLPALDQELAARGLLKEFKNAT